MPQIKTLHHTHLVNHLIHRGAFRRLAVPALLDQLGQGLGCALGQSGAEVFVDDGVVPAAVACGGG
jgi:hypothetical protein